MSGCPSENTLARFAAGRLEEAALAELQEHIDGCADCLSLVMDLVGGSLRSPLPAQPCPPGQPEDFAEYRIVRLLGSGAMGQVFLAHDTLLDRSVAIKFLAAGRPDAAARERFLLEARAIARLSHPNVVSIFRVGETDGRPYLVSELVRGEGLDRWRMPVPWKLALQVGIGVARGLAAAHGRGVLHRDIKPANIVVTEAGDAKLLDFGLAKLLEDLPGAAPPRAPPALPPDVSPALTRTGAILGTPLYMAPEIWAGEPATKRADVYSLGVVIYELCSGRTPHKGVPLRELPRTVQACDAPPLSILVAGLDSRLAAVIERCLARDPQRRFSSGEELREALEQLLVRAHRHAVPAGSPYRGLQCFEAEHGEFFFGRAAEVRAVLERLRTHPFVLVAGDSGVGKSSLCRAGVLPEVAAGDLEDGREWAIVRLFPGRQPLVALATALAPLLGEAEGALSMRLGEDPAAVGRALRRRDGGTRGTLIFLDQMEELFTLAGPAAAALCGEVLDALLLRVPGLRLLGTVRSDFLTRLSALPGLGEEVLPALYLLRPLSAAGVREAVVGPARSKGFRFETPEMVESLVASAPAAEGGLPLLEFALAALWDLRDEARQLIPAEALERLGGVGGALALHADSILAQLTPAQRTCARHILERLITPEGTRSRRRESELLGEDQPDRRRALQALLRGRLLQASAAEEGEETSYEIAHEALLSGWSTLRAWLAHDAERRAQRQHLGNAAREWQRLGRAGEALWSARQLAEAAGLQDADLLPGERAFLAASRLALRRRRLGRGALLAGLPLILGLGYGTVRLQARHDLGRRVAADLYRARDALFAARADVSMSAGLRERAFALFDSGQRGAGEGAWAEVLSRSIQADEGFSRAGQALETALLLDRDREDVRRLFASVLYERALLAERDSHLQQRDELLRRLSLYDRDGAFLRTWNAPAHLQVDSDMGGAAVTIERYVLAGQKRQPVALGPPQPAPLPERELAPGSYRLTLALTGRAPVRYPVLLHRGERLHLSIPLPAAAAVPAGFVYVPAGRFLLGSATDEGVRREFFKTAPLHEVRTGAFLIARHETTYQEWIEYLRALPAEERARRTPQASGFHGELDLRELPDGAYQLIMQPSSQRYQARAGEKMRYLGRARRAVQDWLRFPVSGISFGDALAYAAWLDRSGRVPGARLCTEVEWERAARGADEREFPHGDHLDPDDANYDETYGKQPLGFGPDEAGSHPASRSPFDVDDLVGNVWEWVTGVLSLRPSAIRGGSYYYGSKTDNSTNHEDVEPGTHNLNVGMRVCASVPGR